MSLLKSSKLQLQYMQRRTQLELKRSMSLLSEDDFPLFHLLVKDPYSRQLDSALPRSGHQYLPAQMINNNKLVPVKVKYRGDFATHWGFFKKSWRVKTRKGNHYRGIRTFNLITPKTRIIYSNYMGYKIAELIGLLTPEAELVKLNLNGHYQGMHLFVEQISESLLRNAQRLPGDIYSGEELYGKDVWYGSDKELFSSAGLWRKVAFNNHYPENHRAPLQHLLTALKREGRKGDSAIIDIVDLPSFARLNLFEQLVNSNHIDDFHNWRLYYDPGRGKFFPIVWDLMPWSDHWLPPKRSDLTQWTPPDLIIANGFMKRLHSVPEFIDVKKEVFARFLESDSPDEILHMIESLNQKMEPVLEKEPAIMSENHEWISHQESRARMQDMVTIFSRIISELRLHYPTFTRKIADKEQEVIWRGIIQIDQDTTITAPLLISRGSEIRLSGGASLFIHNKLTIDGTDKEPVLITAAGEQAFGAFVIEGKAASGSRLRGFHMTSGSGYRDDLREFTGMLSIHDVSDIRLSNCKLENNESYDDMLHVVYSRITIEHCEFNNAHMDALDVDMSKVDIRDSIFSGSGNDGVDLMGSTVVGLNLLLKLNGDKGISVGERSQLTIRDSEFYENEIGMQIKDDSRVLGEALQFVDNVTALDAYRKNWRYGNGGHARLCRSQFRSNGKIATTDKHSTILRDSSQCRPLR